MANIENVQKDIIVSIIRKYLKKAKIMMFGSRVTGKNDKFSDVDICLDDGTKIDFKVILDINNDLRHSDLWYFVDILDFNNISDDIKKSILSNHEIID